MVKNCFYVQQVRAVVVRKKINFMQEKKHTHNKNDEKTSRNKKIKIIKFRWNFIAVEKLKKKIWGQKFL